MQKIFVRAGSSHEPPALTRPWSAQVARTLGEFEPVAAGGRHDPADADEFDAAGALVGDGACLAECRVDRVLDVDRDAVDLGTARMRGVDLGRLVAVGADATSTLKVNDNDC